MCSPQEQDIRSGLTNRWSSFVNMNVPAVFITQVNVDAFALGRSHPNIQVNFATFFIGNRIELLNNFIKFTLFKGTVLLAIKSPDH
ncbi:hypothetical protein B9Z47_11880 [Limnohabitans sp. 2KL-1]|nr:hypothetical protein B9Z47_11880 [Limnohabitans sp. 2KL-1]